MPSDSVQFGLCLNNFRKPSSKCLNFICDSSKTIYFAVVNRKTLEVGAESAITILKRWKNANNAALVSLLKMLPTRKSKFEKKSLNGIVFALLLCLYLHSIKK